MLEIMNFYEESLNCLIVLEIEIHASRGEVSWNAEDMGQPKCTEKERVYGPKIPSQKHSPDDLITPTKLPLKIYTIFWYHLKLETKFLWNILYRNDSMENLKFVIKWVEIWVS